MSLRIRRGTDAQRTGKTFEVGEIVYTTDLQQVWIGNGVTAGGIPVVGSNVAGAGLAYNPSSRKIEVSGLTTDDVAQGVNNKYFSTELAVDAVGAALVAGNPSNVGITFTYAQTQDDANRINATVDASAFVDLGLTDIVNDTTPQLGGSLDINSFNITGTGNIGITGNVTATGGTITASAYGTINAKKIFLTDNTSAGVINAGLVLTTNANPNDGDGWFNFNSHHNDASAYHSLVFNRTRGTSSVQTSVQSGDILFGMLWEGRSSDGTTVPSVGISAQAAGSIGAGIIPGKIYFATADATGDFYPKVAIGPEGKVDFIAPTGVLVAGTGTGQVTAGSVATYMRVSFNGTDYAIPLYAIVT